MLNAIILLIILLIIVVWIVNNIKVEFKTTYKLWGLKLHKNTPSLW